VARSLDQILLFLELEHDTMWTVVQGAPWFATAQSRIGAMDQKAPAPTTPAPALPPWSVVGLVGALAASGGRRRRAR
jgi:hypothetical protein